MAAITTASVAVAGSAFQMIKAAKQAKDAKKALENLKVPETTNVYEDVKVSTLGADLQREEMGRRYSEGVDALRSGGVRGVIGGLTSLDEAQKTQEREIAASLDEQQKQIDFAKASDNARIQGVNEARHSSNVAALSSQYSAGQQGVMQGALGIAQGVASGAQMYQDKKDFKAILDAGSSSKGVGFKAPIPINFESIKYVPKTKLG